MLDLLKEESLRLDFEQSELDKYTAKQLTEQQKNHAEKRQLIINDRQKYNDYMEQLTHGLFNMVDEERKDGYRAGFKEAKKEHNPVLFNKEAIRQRSISDAMEKWSDHY